MNEDLEKIAKSIKGPLVDDIESLIHQKDSNRQVLVPHSRQNESSYQSQNVSTHKVADMMEKSSVSPYPKLRLSESKNKTRLGQTSKA